MADAEGLKAADNYGLDIPVSTQSYYLKGLEYADWGIKDRMSRIFNKESGKTVMLAFDHGYIMGPTSGLERIDLSIVPLLEHADSIMCSRGILRSCIPPTFNKPISLHVIDSLPGCSTRCRARFRHERPQRVPGRCQP